jgi:uncharacterized protein YgbK (DUF1537 family)
MPLLILADDLTGAADCAARCRRAGMAITISLRPPTPPLPSGAVAFTSDSRHLPAAVAARRVADLVAGLRELADITWYKKIDSTLRGNIGSELDAMLDTLGRSCAVICPSFPAQNRGLRAGYLSSPLPLARPAHLPTLLAQQSRRRVAAIPLADVEAGAERLADRLAAAYAQAAQLLVVDAMSDQDLRTILAAVGQALPDALLCGSAGLIGALSLGRSAAEPRHINGEELVQLGGAALFVVGSGSATAHRQIAYLRQHSGIDTIEIDLAAGAPDEDRKTASDVLLHLPEPSPRVALDGPTARACAAQLAEAALPIIAGSRPALLALVGGDTALQVLNRLGIERLTVLRELLPGIPLTAGIDASRDRRFVILKAGNHGDDATLADLLRQVRNEE